MSEGRVGRPNRLAILAITILAFMTPCTRAETVRTVEVNPVTFRLPLAGGSPAFRGNVRVFVYARVYVEDRELRAAVWLDVRETREGGAQVSDERHFALYSAEPVYGLDEHQDLSTSRVYIDVDAAPDELTITPASELVERFECIGRIASDAGASAPQCTVHFRPIRILVA